MIDIKALFRFQNSIILVMAILFIALLLAFPKIFLRNNIYYVSKDINKLYAHYISLKEENKFLSQQLEDMKFKNQITDSLILNDIYYESKEEEK